MVLKLPQQLRNAEVVCQWNYPNEYLVSISPSAFKIHTLIRQDTSLDFSGALCGHLGSVCLEKFAESGP